MTEDSLGKALMLKSEERMGEFIEMMDRFDQLDWAEVKNIVTVGVWNPERRHKFFERLRKFKSDGARKPADVPNLEYHLRADVADSFHIADKAGVTGIGSMIFRHDVNLPPWAIYNPNMLIANYDEGGFGVISGPPRMGKTSLACFLLEEWVKRSPRVSLTNIKPLGETIFTYTPGVRELFQAIADMREGIPWLFILDEGSFTYSRPDQVTRRVKDLDKLMRIIGKMYGNMILVEHIPEAVPGVIREFATSYYFCHKPGILSITLHGPNLRHQVKVGGFPLAKTPFDTRDWAFFNTETVNLPTLYEAVSGADDRRKALREFLESPLPEKPKRVTKADEIRRLIKQGLSTNEIAKKVQANPHYVQEIAKTV